MTTSVSLLHSHISRQLDMSFPHIIPSLRSDFTNTHIRQSNVQFAC